MNISNFKENCKNFLKQKFEELLKLEEKNTLPDPKFIMDSYTYVKYLADMGDEENYFIYNSQSLFIEKFIEKSYDILKNINDKNNFFDIFFKQTERINFIIYSTISIYQYLDRIFTKIKSIYSLNKNALELYKNHYFVPLENKFISFFYNIIEKAENLKIDDKDDENIIKYINILNSFDIPNPKLQKINKYQYIWIDVEGKKVNRENYNNFLLKILLFFADKIFDELKNLTIPEYLSNYLEIYIRKNIYFKKYFYLYDNYYFLSENAYEFFIEKNIDKIEEYFFTCDKKAIIKFYQSNEFYYIETLIKEYFLYSFKKRGEKAFDKLNKYFDELKNEKIYSDNDIEKLILKFCGVLGKEGNNKIYKNKKKKNSEKKENKRELTKQKKFKIFNLEKEEEIEEAKEKEKPELIEKECWVFDIWFNKLLNDIINFIKLKVNNYEMLSIHEYIIFSVNYYDSLYNLYKNYFYEHYLISCYYFSHKILKNKKVD